MSKKQDRVAARTPSDLERKYSLDQIANATGVATAAQRTATQAAQVAEQAQRTAAEAVKSVENVATTPEAVFNLLTNSGEMKAIYKGEDGQIYINASYILDGEFLATLIKAGILSSADGSFMLDILNNVFKFQTLNTRIDGMYLSWKDNGDGTFTLIGTEGGGLT